MRKVGIAIACLLVLCSCFAFARDLPVTVPAQTKPSANRMSGAAPKNPKALTDIHDIKPLVSVPVPVSWATVAIWTAACIAAGGVLLGLWFLWRRRRGPSVETIEAVLSPEETALQRLESLSAETGVEGKTFYFQLSFIFREYLQGRFGIDGIEMTTEELLPHMEKVSIDRDLKRDAKKFIVSCDPVKYASAPTLRETMAADFTFIKSFVERTAAPVEDPTGAAGGSTTGSPE